MRDYTKLAPTFWTGKTGRALKRRGIEGVLVALYLVSSPHSNMLGLYYQPVLYLAEETGLTIEGASKGLHDCIACGFCSYDEETKTVWVHEMAAWQIAESLSSGDNRCKGIQKDYDALPDNPFIGAWFDRYGPAFKLARRREFEGEIQAKSEGASQAPSKPHRSQEQEQEQEQEVSVPDGTGASPPLPPAEVQAKPLTAKERVWLLGVPLLGDTAASRSLLGKLSKTYGEDALARVLAEATADPPAEPKAWLVAACEAAKTRTNGHHQPDMLADATPDWAIRAGFENRFLAESAGCGPGNFHKFAAGRRVMQ